MTDNIFPEDLISGTTVSLITEHPTTNLSENETDNVSVANRFDNNCSGVLLEDEFRRLLTKEGKG